MCEESRSADKLGDADISMCWLCANIPEFSCESHFFVGFRLLRRHDRAEEERKQLLRFMEFEAKTPCRVGFFKLKNCFFPI